MPKDLHQIAAPTPEHVEVAGMRITLQRLLNLQGQAVHAAAHIRVAVGQPYPHAARRDDHRRTALITRRSVASPTSAPTRMQVPSGKVISTRAVSAGAATAMAAGNGA